MKRQSIFEVMCERIDAMNIDLLDVSVKKTQAAFEVRPFFKPGWVDTQPLDLRSGNSPAVLKKVAHGTIKRDQA